MGLMKLGNYHLYVERYGSENATPIIFLHGGPGDGCMLLSSLAEKLGEHYYCVCFDQMGCGRSDQIPDDVSFGMSQHADMIESLLKALHVEKAIIYGHGYGGMLASLYAGKYPKSVLGVIYDCPSFDFADSAKSLARFLYRETFIYKSKTSAEYRQCAKIMDTTYLPGDTACVKDIQKLLRYVDDVGIRFYLHKKNFECFLTLLNSLVAEDVASQVKEQIFLRKLLADGQPCQNFIATLQKNTQPSILLVGKYDPICSIEQRRAYLENTENGELVILDNSGSFPHLEEPEQYLYSMQEFISNIDCDRPEYSE